MARKSTSIDYDDAWILENWDRYARTDLMTQAYNQDHGTQIKKDTMISHCGTKLGLRRKHRKNDDFTPEMDEWIRKNYPHLTETKVQDEWLITFGERRSGQSIRLRAWYLKVPKDKKVACMSRAQSQGVPLGSTLVNGGYVLVKAAHDTRQGKRWQMLSRTIWEKAHGEIPKGYVIIYLDGNTRNCNLENLACVPNRWMGYLNSHFGKRNNATITAAQLEWCRLQDAIREKELSDDTGRSDGIPKECSV